MKVLVAEDDLTMSQNIKHALQEFGVEVEIAHDGLIAEKLLKKFVFDCVVLDINLPHKNGYEICQLFRTFNKTTPVLYLTAFDELEDKIQGFESGGDDYLTKPFYMKELFLRIQSLTKRMRSFSDESLVETLILNDLMINKRSKVVKRNEIEINLTPREYQILLKLAEAKGETVSKQDLIKEIWGGSFDANTNTIEVYINFLRNKVDKPFDKQSIKTKVGYGYYLEVEK
jgi:DNA-binding response OmpR family regulator